MNREFLFGFSGYARSGKDTLAAVLVAKHGFKRVAFADALKEEVAKVLGTSVAEIEEDKQRFRPLLQWWGTEWRRTQNDRYWLDRFNERLGDANRVVVTDVRFPNEADEIRRLGGNMVRITRPGCQPANAHSSETALDSWDFDFVVPNNGPLHNLDAVATLLLTQEIRNSAFFPNKK